MKKREEVDKMELLDGKVVKAKLLEDLYKKKKLL